MYECDNLVKLLLVNFIEKYTMPYGNIQRQLREKETQNIASLMLGYSLYSHWNAHVGNVFSFTLCFDQ